MTSVGIFFPHSLNGSLGSTRRVKEIAVALTARLGVQANIYSPYEEDSTLAKGVVLKAIPNLALSFKLDNVVYRLSRTVYYNKRLSGHLLTFVARNSAKLLSNKSVEIMRKDKVSVLQAEQDISLLPAIVAARQLGIPLIADLHNITAEELVAAGVIRKESKVYQGLQDFVGECLVQTDYVCVVSEYMAHYVSSTYGIERSKIVVVPPAAPSRKIGHIKLLPNGRVVYSGMTTYREHVDLFVKSIPCVAASLVDAEFFITDKGEGLSKVKRLAEKLKAKLNFFWFPDERVFFKFLSTCSVGVIPSSNNEARRLGTPIKLFDYMSVGLPVVANDIGGWSRIIEEEEIGILTQDDPAEFCSAIRLLLEDGDLRAKMSANALEAAESKYSWEKSVRPLAEIYEKYLGAKYDVAQIG